MYVIINDKNSYTAPTAKEASDLLERDNKASRKEVHSTPYTPPAPVYVVADTVRTYGDRHGIKHFKIIAELQKKGFMAEMDSHLNPRFLKILNHVFGK